MHDRWMGVSSSLWAFGLREKWRQNQPLLDYTNYDGDVNGARDTAQSMWTCLHQTNEHLSNLETNFNWWHYTFFCNDDDIASGRNMEYCGMGGETSAVAKRSTALVKEHLDNTRIMTPVKRFARPQTVPLLYKRFRSYKPLVSRLARMNMDHAPSWRRRWKQRAKMLHHKLSTAISSSICDSQFFWISLFYKCLIFMSVHSLFFYFMQYFSRCA